jgi:hypothetical protein
MKHIMYRNVVYNQIYYHIVTLGFSLIINYSNGVIWISYILWGCFCFGSHPGDSLIWVTQSIKWFLNKACHILPMKSALFWDITKCRVVLVYWRFGGNVCVASSRVKKSSSCPTVSNNLCHSGSVWIIKEAKDSLSLGTCLTFGKVLFFEVFYPVSVIFNMTNTSLISCNINFTGRPNCPCHYSGSYQFVIMQISPCGICGRQGGTGASILYVNVPQPYYTTRAPHMWHHVLLQ